MGGRPYHDSSAVFRMRIRIISKRPGIVRHADSKLAVNQSGIIHINCCWLRFDEYENLRNLLEIGQFRNLTMNSLVESQPGKIQHTRWKARSFPFCGTSWVPEVLMSFSVTWSHTPHRDTELVVGRWAPRNKEKIAWTDIPPCILLLCMHRGLCEGGQEFKTPYRLLLGRPEFGCRGHCAH